MHGKLRNKIFLMIAIVSVLPIGIAGAITIWSSIVAHRVDVAKIEDGLVNQKSGEIKSLISQTVGQFTLHVEEDVTSIPSSSAMYVLSNLIKTNSALE